MLVLDGSSEGQKAQDEFLKIKNRMESDDQIFAIYCRNFASVPRNKIEQIIDFKKTVDFKFQDVNVRMLFIPAHSQYVIQICNKSVYSTQDDREIINRLEAEKIGLTMEGVDQHSPDLLSDSPIYADKRTDKQKKHDQSIGKEIEAIKYLIKDREKREYDFYCKDNNRDDDITWLSALEPILCNRKYDVSKIEISSRIDIYGVNILEILIKQNKTLKTLSLLGNDKVKLSITNAITLMRAVNETDIMQLNLSGNDIRGKKFEEFIEELKNSKLSTLIFQDNDLNDERFTMLWNCVKNHPTIRSVDFSPGKYVKQSLNAEDVFENKVFVKESKVTSKVCNDMLDWLGTHKTDLDSISLPRMLPDDAIPYKLKRAVENNPNLKLYFEVSEELNTRDEIVEVRKIIKKRESYFNQNELSTPKSLKKEESDRKDFTDKLEKGGPRGIGK